jgi:hypothetical protein
MINDEDMAVASLATLVGSELRTIDTYRDGKGSPANKLDPKLFLNKNNSQSNQHKNKNVVYQEGKAFYAGIDESYVQSLYPDPAPVAASSGSVAAPATVLPVVQPVVNKHSITLKSEESSSTEEAFKQNLVKILKSIDKSLKTIANNLTINQTKSDQTTNQ